MESRGFSVLLCGICTFLLCKCGLFSDQFCLTIGVSGNSCRSLRVSLVMGWQPAQGVPSRPTCG